jgi:hypothetical protein
VFPVSIFSKAKRSYDDGGDVMGRVKKPEFEERKSGVPMVLRDMRHVYQRPMKEDRTAGEKSMRIMYNEQRVEFLRELMKLEERYLGRVVARRAALSRARAKGEASGRAAALAEGIQVTSGESVVADGGSERIRGVIRDLLAGCVARTRERLAGESVEKQG